MERLREMLRSFGSRLAIVTLLIFSLMDPVRGQSDLIEGAKKEGRVVWYGSMSLEDISRLAAAFEKKYPFIKVESFRASAEKVANKIMTETRAGQFLYDTVANPAFDMRLLQKRGLTGKYISPESKAYPAGAKDPEGFWNDLYETYYAIGYNTKLVSKKDAPKGWQDLLDPKWKGKIGMDPEEHEWYAAMLSYMGVEKGRDYMRRLAKQDPQWRKGHTLIAQLMAAGEFPVGIIYAHRMEKMRPAGAPVDWETTVDPIVSGMRVVAIAAKPPHPNAAKLLLDYVLSKEGQTMIRSFDRIPAHPNVESLSPRLDPSKLKIFHASPVLADNFERYVKEFNEIFKPH